MWSGVGGHKSAPHSAKWSGGVRGVSIAPKHVQEFHRAMGRAQAVRDGDTAVVYSVPITDVDAFNAMYQQYQQQDVQPPSEDEANPNHLGDLDLTPLPDYQETAAPAVLREEEAVLVPTEDPLPPTPARGMAVTRQDPPPATSQPPRAPPTKRWPHFTLPPRGDLLPPRGDLLPTRGDLPSNPRSPIIHYEPPTTRLLYTPTQRTTPSPPPSPTTPKYIVTKAAPTTTVPPAPQPSTSTPPTPPPQVFPGLPHTLHAHAPEGSQTGASSSFAVYHDEAEAPLAVPSVQEAGVPAAHYQESSPLFLEQLPPQYIMPEDLPRPLPNTRRHDTQSLEELIFSADPEELLRRGLLPRPVHYVSSHHEADRWVQQQYQKQGEAPTEHPFPAANTLPRETPKAPRHQDQDFHFKKLPHDFRINEWYHLTFTWSAADHQAAIYVNGRLVGTLSGVLVGHTALPGGGLTVVGRTLLPDLTDFDPTSHLKGEVTQLTVWDLRLDEAQVQDVYGCGPAPPTTPALDWRRLSMRFYGQVFLHKGEALCAA